MATLLLDTTVIFDALKLKRGRREYLAQLLRQGHILASCPINFIEVYADLREHEQALTDNRKHSPMPELNLHPLPQNLKHDRARRTRRLPFTTPKNKRKPNPHPNLHPQNTRILAGPSSPACYCLLREHSIQMTNAERNLNAEQDLEKALKQSQKILGNVVPRLLTQKPQIAANSISHGLTGQTVFLEPDDLRFYLSIGAQYMEEFRPIGISEIQLAQLIIDTQWRLNRAGALSTMVHTSTVILEAEALQATNPQVDAETIHAHAEASAVRRQCEGPNTLEKLGRHETRLWRALRQMRKDFREMCDLRPQAERDQWTMEASEACQWYNTLSALTESLVTSREELQAKSVTVTESADSLLCKKPVPTPPTEHSKAPEPAPINETEPNPSPLRAAA